MNIENRVKDVISQLFAIKVEDLTDDHDFENDLSGDSIDITELIIEIEEEFDIDISDDDAKSVKTVGDMIKLIEKSVVKNEL